MADTYDTDEFGFPLTAHQRLARMQGVAPAQLDTDRGFQKGVPHTPLSDKSIENFARLCRLISHYGDPRTAGAAYDRGEDV